MAALARVGATPLALAMFSVWICILMLQGVLTDARTSPADESSSGKADNVAHPASWTHHSEQCTYTVVTHTGNIEFAGTDADVNVEFFNKMGQSVLFVDLNSGQDNFLRGQTDTFTMVGKCVFDICKIHLSHDNAGVNPSWFVNSVSVSMDFEAVVFNIYEWLAKDEPPYTLSYIGNQCA
ncbi:hypothetical protein MPTK1_6g17080 [Marchantia polymorpha subsp. ruderalis]|uniref:PLAT domain-containing protein n=2 Tax=Marchantia polymorpha TaxID=3197 RepID=A0AAF6BSX1_MARPO|nr:hypothetical protein MARPO_0144s0007 [Marchantia polymorpha]BBN15105.1 hypothetical protein Mp_6g17080 [Marchantia polymorpha subsp. ruderalis]|eukprot:PTQ29288.1 hypothetical protein MARPO_0144s0007 [Marchantia polymorpha]